MNFKHPPMRHWQKLLLLPLLVFGIAGCTPSEPTPVDSPQHILSLSAAATQILIQLGTPPQAIDEYGVIGTTDIATPPPVVVGRGSAISQEKLRELKIDLALVWSYQQDAVRTCREMGIRAETISPQLRLESYPDLILQLGELTGKTPEAERLAKEFRQKLAPITQAMQTTDGVPPVRVYFELYAPGKAAADASYLGDLLRAAGGRSILSQKSGLVSLETIVEQDPEIIFYVEDYASQAEIAARPGFRNLCAVQKNRIYPIPRRLVVEGLFPLEAIAVLKQKITLLER